MKIANIVIFAPLAEVARWLEGYFSYIPTFSLLQGEPLYLSAIEPLASSPSKTTYRLAPPQTLPEEGKGCLIELIPLGDKTQMQVSSLNDRDVDLLVSTVRRSWPQNELWCADEGGGGPDTRPRLSPDVEALQSMEIRQRMQNLLRQLADAALATESGSHEAEAAEIEDERALTESTDGEPDAQVASAQDRPIVPTYGAHLRRYRAIWLLIKSQAKSGKSYEAMHRWLKTTHPDLVSEHRCGSPKVLAKVVKAGMAGLLDKN